MFERLLERLAQALESRSIAYMVIGGQAVLLYAEPRLTRDVDVTLVLSVARLQTLLEVIGALGLRVRVAGNGRRPACGAFRSRAWRRLIGSGSKRATASAN
jgi:hypothetical protein